MTCVASHWSQKLYFGSLWTQDLRVKGLGTLSWHRVGCLLLMRKVVCCSFGSMKMNMRGLELNVWIVGEFVIYKLYEKHYIVVGEVWLTFGCIEWGNDWISGANWRMKSCFKCNCVGLGSQFVNEHVKLTFMHESMICMLFGTCWNNWNAIWWPITVGTTSWIFIDRRCRVERGLKLTLSVSHHARIWAIFCSRWAWSLSHAEREQNRGPNPLVARPCKARPWHTELKAALLMHVLLTQSVVQNLSC